MRMPRVATIRFIVVVAAMTLSTFATPATAQQNQAPTKSNGQPPPPANNNAQNGLVAAPKPAPLPATPEEFTLQGQEILARGNSLAATVRQMLEDARKEADIIKITCLDNKLTQIDVNNRTAESRLDAMKKAVDNDRRTHEFTVLTVIGQKLQVLDQEAHQCVGQSMYDTGSTKVVTEIDTSKVPIDENASMPPVITPPSLPTIPPAASGVK
jgi:hypothetical protein